MGVYSSDGMLEKGTKINFAVVNKPGKMWHSFGGKSPDRKCKCCISSDWRILLSPVYIDSSGPGLSDPLHRQAQNYLLAKKTLKQNLKNQNFVENFGIFW